MSDKPVTATVRVFRLPYAPDLPAYGTPGAAGFDLRAAVDAPMMIRPGERKLVPTGLVVALPRGTELQIRARSGLAFKNGITVVQGVGTIDEDYRGEVGVLLINHGSETFFVNRGDRIAQGVLASCLRAEFVEVASADALGTTERAGGFGSTGTK